MWKIGELKLWGNPNVWDGWVEDASRNTDRPGCVKRSVDHTFRAGLEGTCRSAGRAYIRPPVPGIRRRDERFHRAVTPDQDLRKDTTC